MRTGIMRLAVAGTAAALLVGGLVAPAASAQPAATTWVGSSALAPAGDAAVGAMTRSQARRAYVDALCPTNIAIGVLGKAESDPRTRWSVLQPLVRKLAALQRRTSQRLTYPKQPWPVSVRRLIPAVADLQLAQSGANEVLASAASLAEYKALLESLRVNAPRDLGELVTAGLEAGSLVKARLGLGATGWCTST